MNPHTFDTHDTYSPISHYTSNSFPVFIVNQVSIYPSLEFSSEIIEIDHKNHPFLHRIILLFCQISSPELFNLMQLVWEVQDVPSPHKYAIVVPDILFHITLQPDAEMKKQSISKVPIHSRD